MQQFFTPVKCHVEITKIYTKELCLFVSILYIRCQTTLFYVLNQIKDLSCDDYDDYDDYEIVIEMSIMIVTMSQILHLEDMNTEKYLIQCNIITI